MLKKLTLASATAAVALIAAADFSDGTFGLTSEAAAAELGTSVMMAQVQMQKQGPAKPTPPTRRPSKGTSGGPQAPGGLQTELLPDLYPDYFYPTIQEGKAGSHYCSHEQGQLFAKSRFAQVMVRSNGNKTVGQVAVVFEFSGGKKVHQIVTLNSPNDVKGAGVRIPDNAWSGGKAYFTFRIDHSNKVAEHNENNNVIQSFCSDPNY